MTRAAISLTSLLVFVSFAALSVSLIEGTPADLPGVALGSAVLLHAERVTALLAVSTAMLSVLAQATQGQLPTQLSTGGITYERAAATDDNLDEVTMPLDHIERTIEDVFERLDKLRHPGYPPRDGR